MKKLISIILASIIMLTSTAMSLSVGAAPPADGGRTDYITDNCDIDELLARPYNDDVPLGFSENLFALHSTGWGFSRVYRTGLTTEYNMSVNVSVNGTAVTPDTTLGIYRPSYTEQSRLPSANAVDTVISVNTGPGYPMAKASFTHPQYGLVTTLNNGVTSGNSTRWTSWNSPLRGVEEWVEIDFGDNVVSVDAVNLYVYNDGGGSTPPSAVKIRYWGGEEGILDFIDAKNVAATPATPGIGKNSYRFDNVKTTRVRAYLTPRTNSAVTLEQFEVISAVAPAPVSVTGYKYISPDDMAVSVVKVKNLSNEPITADVTATSTNARTAAGQSFTGTQSNFNLRLSGLDFSRSGNNLTKSVTVSPGAEVVFRIALAFSPSGADNNAANIDRMFADADYLGTQKDGFNAWYLENVPYFDSPDPIINQTYYFRWLVYRNNIRKSPVETYIITEFMPNVSWASTYNAIPCPLGHHYYEGRWIRDTKYLDSYTDYWFHVGNPRLYSSWLADACYARYMVDGDSDKIISYLPNLITNIKGWDTNSQTPFYDAYGLYRSIADRDGMENAIGSDGLRPTINSYIYGDSIAIAKIADMIGDTTTRDTYISKAVALKQSMNNLWDNGFYRVRRTTSGYPIQNVVEEIGLVPWYFNMPDADKSVAWNRLMDPQYLFAEYGPTTAQRSHSSYRPGTQYGTGTCRWDGPSWPFATTQTLVGMANLLNNYDQNYVDKDDYYTILWNYANSHYKANSLDNKKYSWLAENLNPENGRWIADEARSINYNHSSFNDMIITGLIGLRPSDDNVLEINPLLPDGKWDYFCLENVPYHGHNITVLYDKHGTKYNAGAGLSVFVDGARSLTSEDLQKAEIILDDVDYLARVMFFTNGNYKNLAKGKQGSASSVQSGNPIASAFDGNTGTRWCANNGNYPAWLQVDLGDTYDISGFNMNWESGSAAYRYTVSVSNVPDNWTAADIVLDKSANQTANGNEMQIVKARGRYVRLNVTGASSGWASLWEFGVLAPAGDGPADYASSKQITKLSSANGEDVAALIRLNEKQLVKADTNIFIAVYDAGNRMLQLDSYPAPENGLYPITIPESAASVSVFIWDNNFVPLIAAITLKD